jgi:hypothetical protein
MAAVPVQSPIYSSVIHSFLTVACFKDATTATYSFYRHVDIMNVPIYVEVYGLYVS